MATSAFKCRPRSRPGCMRFLHFVWDDSRFAPPSDSSDFYAEELTASKFAVSNTQTAETFAHVGRRANDNPC